MVTVLKTIESTPGQPFLKSTTPQPPSPQLHFKRGESAPALWKLLRGPCIWVRLRSLNELIIIKIIIIIIIIIISLLLLLLFIRCNCCRTLNSSWTKLRKYRDLPWESKSFICEPTSTSNYRFSTRFACLFVCLFVFLFIFFSSYLY